MIYGVNILMLWVLVSAIYGISPKITWNYYLLLTADAVVGYALLWVAVWVAAHFGTPYNGEGSLYLMIPTVVSPAILLFASGIKFFVILLFSSPAPFISSPELTKSFGLFLSIPP